MATVLTGGSYTIGAAGASTPASGVDQTNGPWAIEQQSMQIDYVRIPDGKLTAETFGLSAVTGTFTVKSTALAIRVTAQYSKVKSYTNYNTSSFTQAQKFNIIGSTTDSYGNSYGTVSGLILGPAGSIVTQQPYIHRRAWTDTIDEPLLDQATCYSYWTGYYDSHSKEWVVVESDISDADDFERSLIFEEAAGSFLNEGENEVHNDQQFYYLPGTYTTTSEQDTQTIMLIENVAFALLNKILYSQMPTLNTNGSPLADCGMDYYDTSRHDYT